MARDGDVVGEGMADRLGGRLDRSQLKRVSMPDGGEVFKGAVAKAALEAVGARAMTFDHSIIVADDFDPGKPEDQALYAHESHHLSESGGEGGDIIRDSEEIAARAIERMVLHRARGGAPAEGEPEQPAAGPAAPSAPTAPTAPSGYEALRAQGWSHEEVVVKLAREVVNRIEEQNLRRRDRHGDIKSSF